MTLFDLCIKEELEVIIKGLESIDPKAEISMDKLQLTSKQEEARKMCLGTAKFHLQDRYTRWENKPNA